MISKDFKIIEGNLYNIVIGEIIAVNDNGTYDVKISKTKHKYPHVKNVNSEKIFNAGDIVKVGLEYESKKMPIIIGQNKEGEIILKYPHQKTLTHI